MKTKLHILLLFAIVNINCKNNNFNPQGNWVGISNIRHSTFYSGDPALMKMSEGDYIDTFDLKGVLSFNKDTFVYTNFNETVYHGFTEHKMKFELNGDSIYVEHEGESKPIEYSFIDGNILVLNLKSSEDAKYENHYVQVEEFKMANRENEINSFLTSSPIVLNDRTDKIELDSQIWYHMGKFIQDSLEMNYGSGNDWYFYSLGNELFLIIGNQIIHVSNFNNDILYGKKYGIENSEVKISKSSYSKKFNTHLLKGKWVVIKSSLNNTPKLNDEELEISNNKIIITDKNSIDTLEWNLNKYKNKIIITSNNRRYREYGSCWKINTLSKNQFVLKRKIYDEEFNPKFEILTLKKIMD